MRPDAGSERSFSLTRDRRPIRKANAVFPAISPLLNGRVDGYPAFVAAALAVHRGISSNPLGLINARDPLLARLVGSEY
jgi:hypothetical protein